MKWCMRITVVHGMAGGRQAEIANIATFTRNMQKTKSLSNKYLKISNMLQNLQNL